MCHNMKLDFSGNAKQVRLRRKRSRRPVTDVDDDDDDVNEKEGGGEGKRRNEPARYKTVVHINIDLKNNH